MAEGDSQRSDLVDASPSSYPNPMMRSQTCRRRTRKRRKEGVGNADHAGRSKPHDKKHGWGGSHGTAVAVKRPE